MTTTTAVTRVCVRSIPGSTEVEIIRRDGATRFAPGTYALDVWYGRGGDDTHHYRAPRLGERLDTWIDGITRYVMAPRRQEG